MDTGARELTAQEAIERAMIEAGVFLLTSTVRRQIAVSMAIEGHTPEDVRVLWDYVRTSHQTPEQAKRTLAAVLKEAERRKDAIQNVRSHAQHMRWHGEYGAKIRHDNMEKQRRLDREWQDYLRQRATQPPEPRAKMSWERP